MTIADVERILKPDIKKLELRGYSATTVHNCIERYLAYRDKYTPFLEQLDAQFRGDPAIRNEVHSVRYRTKDPTHLAAKLATKCLKKGKLITPDILFDPEHGVTDLGGIRVLHLYKSQWIPIHKYITEQLCSVEFSLQEQIAYVRRGQPHSFYEKDNNDGIGFDEKEIRDHEFDYASLHYVLRPTTVAEPIYVECQVRTVFEEGWGEIDHAWRYPAGANLIVESQLGGLNKTSSLANDLATTLGDMKRYLPTFIPWDLEQRLERSADRVDCATLSLDWAARYTDLFISQIRESHVSFYYWCVDTDEARANVESLRKHLEAENLADRVVFRYIPPMLIEIYPLFSDVLLLRNAVNPVNLKYQDIAVMSAPVPTTVRVEDHLDIVIYDTHIVGIIRNFFDQLPLKLGRA